MGARREQAWLGALAAVALTGLLAAASDPAWAEMQVGVYGGWNGSFDSDVDLKQPNGTDMSLSDVPWDGASFGGPPYYGVRGIYWFDHKPGWGVAVDYSHAKVKAELNDQVTVSGTRDGADVSGQEPVGDTFSVLEFTDGLNLLFVNAMYRWQGPRWTPYAGLGVGLSIPHVEVQRANDTTKTFEYQVAGVAFQGLVGAELALNDRWGMFGEYKLSYSQNDADLNGGGSLETDIWTNHVILGLSFHFQRPAPALAPGPYK